MASLSNSDGSVGLTEADALRRDIEELKRHPFDKFALKSDVEQCQSSVRKLAESMQTVKTILGMKIQSEQKLRVEEIKKLQDEVISLRQLIEPLLHRNQLPRVFIKPEGHEMEPRDVIEMAAPEINKWSMYSAYRWLHWKSKIMYIKWSLSNRKSAPKNPPEAADKTPEEAKKGPTPPPDHPWDEDEDGKEKPQ